MSFFLKWLGGSLLCALPFLIAIDAFSPVNRPALPDISGSTPRIEEWLGSVAKATKRLFTTSIAAPPMGNSFLASDPAHLEARDRYLKTFLEYRGDHDRFTSISGESPIQYQVKGLRLLGPFADPLTETDRALGIGASLVYRLEAEGHRREPGPGRNAEHPDWTPGPPPGLRSFTLIRRGTDWIVEDGPIGRND
jgi:hypothetical protein